jgi:hypothetical protein
MKLFMLVVMFFLMGAFFIISNENIKLNTKENVDLFFNHYNQWLLEVGSQGYNIVGYVVKMEWLPDENIKK